MKPTGIKRIDEQQERERIALEERKRHIEKMPEIMDAIANRIDLKQPAGGRHEETETH